MSNYIIETDNLIVEFPSVRAVDGVSIRVEEGEIFGLVGPDGAGKTTTIRVLATILKPTSGKVLLMGKDILRDARAVRGKIGYMSQKFNLYGDLTVEENLRFFADVYSLSESERRTRMKELLHFARLEEFTSRRADFLSGGMKQKLALACTLIYEPAGRFFIRRHEAKAGARMHPYLRADHPVPGRADNRRRPGEPPRVLGHSLRASKPRHHALCFNALYGRGRALLDSCLHG